MALSDWLINKVAQRVLSRAIYQSQIHEGTVNVMPDNPDAYLEQGYSANTTVYSVIDRVDKMRKQARLRLMQRDSTGKVKEVDKHDLLKFTKRVNSHTTTDDFISEHLIYYLTVGENFIYKPKISSGVDKGKVIEMFTLPVTDVEIIEGDFLNPVKGYRLETNTDMPFLPEEVYHAKMFNPNYRKERSMHGLSPLRAAARTVSRLNEGEITQLKQLQNQGAPYILTREQQVGAQTQSRLTDAQILDLQEKVKKSSKDNHRGLPLILKDKFSKLDLGQKLADLELIESSAAGVIALCAVYGLPPELFGYGQKTYNNMATARKSAWTDCIMPNLDVVAQVFNATTIYGTPYETENLFWDFDYSEVEELQEGLKEMVEWMKKAGWSLNEVRVATGKPKIDNPLADEPIVNMGEAFLSDFSADLDGEKDFGDYLKVT